MPRSKLGSVKVQGKVAEGVSVLSLWLGDRTGVCGIGSKKMGIE